MNEYGSVIEKLKVKRSSLDTAISALEAIDRMPVYSNGNGHSHKPTQVRIPKYSFPNGVNNKLTISEAIHAVLADGRPRHITQVYNVIKDSSVCKNLNTCGAILGGMQRRGKIRRVSLGIYACK